MAEARRSGLKPAVKRLVCPCGAPVTVQPSAPADGASAEQHDGPVQPKVMPCGACGRLLVVDDPNVGRVVQGKWRLVRRLGQGGMGTVYLALETSVDREVALKFLHRHLAEREEYRTRFEQEARIMARVEHPNLAGLYSVERDGSVPFLVMKFVRGQPLSRLMRDKKVLTLEETLPLTVQMAAALSALHARGYVHRDLKPGNVMVSAEGHVTLLDFGLTRTFDQNLTRPGVALGSPQYMSPEQVLAGSLDARSDLYSLGLLTSELLVGHRPYRDEHTKAMLLQHLHDAPEPPHLANDKVPEVVSMVLLKALSKKAADRQPTVEAFVEALVTAANVGPVKLPARETAEAMLAAVSRPSPVPDAPPDAEVAEVVPHETLSAPVPIASEPPALTPKNLPELSATVSDLSPGRSLGGAVDQRTEVVPAWHEKTEAVPAWPDGEPAVQVTAPAPRYSDEVTAPLVPGVRVGRKPDEATLPLRDAGEGVTWQLVVSLVGLSIVILVAAWVLLT